jgi:hypothetical protein
VLSPPSVASEVNGPAYSALRKLVLHNGTSTNSSDCLTSRIDNSLFTDRYGWLEKRQRSYSTEIISWKVRVSISFDLHLFIMVLTELTHCCPFGTVVSRQLGLHEPCLNDVSLTLSPSVLILSPLTCLLVGFNNCESRSTTSITPTS